MSSKIRGNLVTAVAWNSSNTSERLVMVCCAIAITSTRVNTESEHRDPLYKFPSFSAIPRPSSLVHPAGSSLRRSWTLERIGSSIPASSPRFVREGNFMFNLQFEIEMPYKQPRKKDVIFSHLPRSKINLNVQLRYSTLERDSTRPSPD